MDKCELCAAQAKLITCLNTLLICYRVNKRPPGKLLDDIRKYKAEVERLNK